MNREVMEIAEVLGNNPMLFQVMKAAIEVKDVPGAVEKLTAAARWMKGEVEVMRTDDIKILPRFAAHPPRREKMERKRRFYRENGFMESRIILDTAGNLIDGYTSYLLAKENGLAEMPVERRRQVVAARFRKGGRLYYWNLLGLMVDKVRPGDCVMVQTSHGAAAVTVEAVKEWPAGQQEPTESVIGPCWKHRKAVRK